MMPESSAAEQQELMDLFYEEVNGLTEEMAHLLESSGTKLDVDELHRLRRWAHSIKGSSRLVGSDFLGTLAEAMEGVFQAAGEERLPLTSELVVLLHEGVETCQRLLSSEADERSKKLLRQLIAKVHPQGSGGR